VSDNARTDHIRTEYHPNSGKRAKMFHIDDPSYDTPSTSEPLPEPWSPFFDTRKDFLVSEILLEGALNKDLCNRLLTIFKLCHAGKGRVTLSNFSQVETAWEHASVKLTPFELSTTDVLYKGKQMKFNVYHRPLWEWATDLIQSPQLAPHFRWDAEKIYRCSEASSQRVFNEPCSADAFWEAQSQIPKDGKPLCLILYADKTRLSSFGTAQGYPVVARCANLPASIRNGNGVGGRCVVGWLPIVKEDPKEWNKPEFVNFKRTVWHESFLQVIQSIAGHSKTGCWLECGDSVRRWIFPIVTMLSADYEEQCVMALIRGTTSKFPCPKCLVRQEDLANLVETWPLRTTAHSHELVHQARELSSAQEREKLLSEYGLRNVNNVFWQLQYTDVHHAVSFDRLHSNNTGLFGRHLWGAFKQLINGYGRKEAAQVDAQFDAVPRWSGLIHFGEVMTVSFTDGTKFEDISKVLVFVAHNIISRSDKAGWLLLCAVRSFTIVDLYLAFEEHTELTIAAGRQEIRKFASLMEPKNWNFPKMHALVHCFDDIEAKGASRNYNTKPNEKLHGPLKKSYALRTNFKNFAGQILRFEHMTFVSVLIRSHIDELERIAREANEGATMGPELRGKLILDGHISLHSQQPMAPLISFGDDFHLRLASWLTSELEAFGVQLPQAIVFSPEDNITEYRSVKVVYKSKGHFFARLLLIFSVSVAHSTYTVCLIQPLDTPIGSQRPKDLELGLHRVRTRRATEFIFSRSIIRGVPLIKDFDKEGDFYIMDVADHTGDLFLRCKDTFSV
ncbi:hypothetical protein EI94DRAFT_1576741, partial [Lactarius quietus]